LREYVSTKWAEGKAGINRGKRERKGKQNRPISQKEYLQSPGTTFFKYIFMYSFPSLSFCFLDQSSNEALNHSVIQSTCWQINWCYCVKLIIVFSCILIYFICLFGITHLRICGSFLSSVNIPYFPPMMILIYQTKQDVIFTSLSFLLYFSSSTAQNFSHPSIFLSFFKICYSIKMYAGLILYFIQSNIQRNKDNVL